MYKPSFVCDKKSSSGTSSLLQVNNFTCWSPASIWTFVDLLIIVFFNQAIGLYSFNTVPKVLDRKTWINKEPFGNRESRLLWSELSLTEKSRNARHWAFLKDSTCFNTKTCSLWCACRSGVQHNILVLQPSCTTQTDELCTTQTDGLYEGGQWSRTDFKDTDSRTHALNSLPEFPETPQTKTTKSSSRSHAWWIDAYENRQAFPMLPKDMRANGYPRTGQICVRLALPTCCLRVHLLPLFPCQMTQTPWLANSAD